MCAVAAVVAGLGAAAGGEAANADHADHVDASFGDGGLVTTDVSGIEDGENADEDAFDVAIGPTGGIVAAGGIDRVMISITATARYRPNGELDPGYHGNGVRTDTASAPGWVAGVDVGPTGGIVVAGNEGTEQGDASVVGRLRPNGSVDQGFDGNDVYNVFPWFTDVVIDSDGGLVLTGSADAGMGVAKTLPNGSRDTSFGEDGVVVTAIGDEGSGAAAATLDADGNIIVAGHTDEGDDPASADLVVARYLPDGSLDTSFGDGGIARTDVDGTIDYSEDVAIDGAGRIVVVGTARPSAIRDTRPVVTRYLPNGALDASFGDGGVVTIDPNGRYANGSGMAIDSQDRVAVVGYTGYDRPNFFAARLMPDGSVDGSFGDGGVVVTDFNRGSDFAYGCAIDAAGNLVVAGSAEVDGDSRFAIARHSATGDTTAITTGE